jgi:hypothetical protein
VELAGTIRAPSRPEMDGVSALMSSPGQKGSHDLTLQGGTHVIPQRCRQVRPDGDNGAPGTTRVIALRRPAATGAQSVWSRTSTL